VDIGDLGYCFAFLRLASRAATALRARARRCSGVKDCDLAAFRALADRSSAVSAAAAFFPPLLPCLRK